MLTESGVGSAWPAAQLTARWSPKREPMVASTERSESGRVPVQLTSEPPTRRTMRVRRVPVRLPEPLTPTAASRSIAASSSRSWEMKPVSWPPVVTIRTSSSRDAHSSSTDAAAHTARSKDASS